MPWRHGFPRASAECRCAVRRSRACPGTSSGAVVQDCDPVSGRLACFFASGTRHRIADPRSHRRSPPGNPAAMHRATTPARSRGTRCPCGTAGLPSRSCRRVRKPASARRARSCPRPTAQSTRPPLVTTLPSARASCRRGTPCRACCAAASRPWITSPLRTLVGIAAGGHHHAEGGARIPVARRRRSSRPSSAASHSST